jgi:DNA-binding transcriptional LysR family regulator
VSFEHLKLFRDIAATGSVSRGAERNGISQSAASQHLQDLEHDLGTTLLDRSRRPATLTEAGRVYLEFCRDVLRLREEMEAGIGRCRETEQDFVRVASIYSVGLSEMSRLEREFRSRRPTARLEVEYLRPERVWEEVAEGRAELGLMSYATPTREVAVLPWRREEMVVAMAADHPLAERSALKPGDLEGIDFISFDDDLPIRKNVDRFLREHGVHVRVALHFDNLQMIQEAVACGAGVSIMPERILRAEVQRGRLATVPLEGRSLFRPLSIVHRKRQRFTAATLEFLELLREQPVEEDAPKPAPAL